jgi:hypothetical protein
MGILRISLLYLVLSMNFKADGEIIVENFKKQNCQYGVPPTHGPLVERKTRSKLKCAAECARQTCKSYRYDRTTESCYMSASMIYDNSAAWYCVPFSGKFHFYSDCYQNSV